MYNKKELKVQSSAKGKKNPYNKDILWTPEGQLKFPGLPTRVPSSEITMENIPYPVYGVDELGNAMMMLPGQEYSFPGSYVDEYPMVKRGGQVPLSLPEKRTTSKNIKTSLNKLISKRNELLYGPSGRRYFKMMQEGGETGWLDRYDKGGPLKVNKDLNQAFMRGEGRPTAQEAYLMQLDKFNREHAGKQATISADSRPESVKKAAKKRMDYIENPTVMDYIGQAGYVPLLALSNPFEIAEKLKEIRTINSDPALTAGQKFDQLGNIGTDATKWALLNAATEGATEGLVPVIGALGKKGKDAVVKAVQNTHKINPWAFKPNPEAYYRGVGKEGMEDIFQSGVIRSKKQHAYPEPYFSKGIIGDSYSKGYFAELTGEPMKGVGSFPEGSLIQTPVNTVHIDNPNLKLYQKDWLRGYKQVDVPSQLPGSPNVAKAALPNPLGVLDSFIPSINPFSFIADGGDLTSISPLNWIPGYGKSLKGEGKAYRKFGNDLSHVLETGTLSPKGGSKLRIGRGKIVNEGNWAALDKPWEKYPGVFTAEFDFKKPGSNLGYINPSSRNGVLITDAEKRTLPDIPVSDPGLEFYRRLPFSTRYIPLDKQKILAGKFQLGQAGSHLQSLAEKYGRGLGLIGTAGALTGQGEEAIKWYNDHTINPIIEAIKEGINDPAGIMDRTKRDWNKLTQKQGGQVDWLSEFE